ncbi:MAG: amidohydrolase [Bacteroidota bacterium]
MKRLVLLLILINQFAVAQKDKQEMMVGIEAKKGVYAEKAMEIWDWSELGYQEEKSARSLQALLESEGFEIKAGVAEIPTAFVATYGSGSPVIGVLGEYDALPGLSQTATPIKQAREGFDAGHACGHHLFGVGSAAAAIALKDWLKDNKKSGTVQFFGTPAEEGGSGKVYMVRAGLFDNTDVVLQWHPGSSNGASAMSTLANKTGKFRFYGVSAHAASAPHRGRSALDGVEAMNAMVNMMREHVTDPTRIHYVITNGGRAPNVVPDFAEVYYYVRHPDVEQVKDVWNRIVKAADGAALGTETRYELEVTGGVYNILPNEVLAKQMHKNLQIVGGVSYTDEERAFAEKIAETLGQYKLPLSVSEEVLPYVSGVVGSASTDVGDVSWAVPTVGMQAATWVPGVAAHSWQAVACGGTSIGVKGMMVAAKSMALTGLDLFNDPKLIEAAKVEWMEKRGSNFNYEALVGDRAPALDYRK